MPAIVYGAFGVFGLAVVLVSTQPLHRIWGIWAVGAYGCAALISVPRLRWGRELVLVVTVAGALIAPLCWLAATSRGMAEVGVVAHSASQLVHHGRPYQSAAQLGADVNGYNPYLPGMTLFGVPHALFGSQGGSLGGSLGGVVTDPRVWDGIVFVLLFWAALRVAGASEPARRTALLAGSPLIAFPLAVSGNDLPVVGLICLGLALALAGEPDRQRPVAAGIVLGAAAALKATAWPALLVIGLLFAARNGRGAAAKFAAAAVAVLTVVVGPFLVIQPRALIDNTIEFPLGLTKAHSPAASPLPGHLLAATGHAGHLVVIALMMAAAAAIGVALLARPPRTVVFAAGYLVLTLTLLFTLAPATRWGYFVYPLGIMCWLWLAGLIQPRRAWPARSVPDNVKGMDLRVNGWLVIPDGELRERFSRSSGPGGQSVNTADSRVELSFDVGRSPSLPDWARPRALERLAGRLAGGVLTVAASEQRSQLANRQAARARLAALLRDALAPPQRPRVPTRPSRGANERRLEAKRGRAAVKRTRRYDSREAELPPVPGHILSGFRANTGLDRNNERNPAMPHIYD